MSRNLSWHCIQSVRVKDTNGKQYLIAVKVGANKRRTARELSRASAATASSRPRATRRDRHGLRPTITANYSVHLVHVGNRKSEIAATRRRLNVPLR